MPRFDKRNGSLSFKIVFCGPGHGGKTTALRQVHSALPAYARGKLVTIATETDRTVFFDFFPLLVGPVGDIDRPVTFHCYTAPGQIFYAEACARVLRDADGVVFVADSQETRQAANDESLGRLKGSVSAWGGDFSQLPVVFLYNKRDLPDPTPLGRMRGQLNPEGRPDFEGVAATGQGLLQSLDALCELVIDAYRARGGA